MINGAESKDPEGVYATTPQKGALRRHAFCCDDASIQQLLGAAAGYFVLSVLLMINLKGLTISPRLKRPLLHYFVLPRCGVFGVSMGLRTSVIPEI